MPTSVRTNYLAKIGPKFWLSWLEPSGEHIDAWTKWPPFCRRQIAFFMEKCLFPLKILWSLAQLTISPAASVQIMTRLLTNHMHANICTDVNQDLWRHKQCHKPERANHKEEILKKNISSKSGGHMMWHYTSSLLWWWQATIATLVGKLAWTFK